MLILLKKFTYIYNIYIIIIKLTTKKLTKSF